MEGVDLNGLAAAIDELQLLAVVRRALGDSNARILHWDRCPVHRGGNPVTAGLWHFSGEGTTRSGVVPWSLVLKLLREPCGERTHEAEAGTDSRHWNYWRREALVYRSGLLDRLPAGMAAPACFGVEELADGQLALWLEPIAGVNAGWTTGQYALVAIRLGRLGGAQLQSEASLCSEAWLSRRLLHQWCDAYAAIISPDERSSGAITFAPLLAILDAAPKTLCHQDVSPANAAIVTSGVGEETVVLLDWGLAGIGAIGEDLGPLLMSALGAHPGVKPAWLVDHLLASYLSGLAGAGWVGDAPAVRRSGLAATTLRKALWMAREQVGMRARGVDRIEIEERQARSRQLVSGLLQMLAA